MTVTLPSTEMPGTARCIDEIGKASFYLRLEETVASQSAAPDPNLVHDVLAFARPHPELLLRLREQPLVLSRPVATANCETLRYFALATRLKRPPLILTMPEDRFTPDLNASKRRLGKLTVETECGSPRSIRIVDFQTAARARFIDMRCHDGTPFIDFHGELLGAALGPSAEAAIVDGTAFWRGDKPREAYPRLFALMTCLGVLAESYATDGPEAPFTQHVVLPAIDETVARFGLPPRIVQLLPAGEELDPVWEEYPRDALPRALRASRKARAV